MRHGSYFAKTCPEAAVKAAAPHLYGPDTRNAKPALMEKLATAGDEFERAVRDVLADIWGDRMVVVRGLNEDAQVLADGTEGAKVFGQARLQKEEDTWNAYVNPRTRIIWNPRIGPRFEALLSEYVGEGRADLDRVSEPDLIWLGDALSNGSTSGGSADRRSMDGSNAERSKSPLRAMHFIDVKSHRPVDSEVRKTPVTFRVSELDTIAPDLAEATDVFQRGKIDDFKQLAHYYSHGANLGVVAAGEPGRWVGVIGRDDNLRVWWFDVDSKIPRVPETYLTKYLTAFYETKAAVEAAAVDKFLTSPEVEPEDPAWRLSARLGKPARLATGADLPLFPAGWSSACKGCEWYTVCRPEIESWGDRGHITLVNGVQKAQAADLALNDGASDVAKLAALEPSGKQPDEYKRGDKDKARDAAIYTARARIQGRPIVRPGVNLNDLLPVYPIEVDFDCEDTTTPPDGIDGDITSELAPEQSNVYMWGVVVSRDGVVGEYNPNDEYDGDEARVFAQIWAQFQTLINEVDGNHDQLRFYHYSHHELGRMKALARNHHGKPGIPNIEDVETFYGTWCTDLYEICGRGKHIYWSTTGESIKVLARLAGFDWRDSEAGGDNSIVWHDKAVSAEPGSLDWQENVSRLRQYNEDDVNAQIALRNWLRAGMPPR